MVAIARARVRSLEFGLGEALDFLPDRPAGVGRSRTTPRYCGATKPTFAGKSYAELLDFGATLFRRRPRPNCGRRWATAAGPPRDGAPDRHRVVGHEIPDRTDRQRSTPITPWPPTSR